MVGDGVVGKGDGLLQAELDSGTTIIRPSMIKKGKRLSPVATSEYQAKVLKSFGRLLSTSFILESRSQEQG